MSAATLHTVLPTSPTPWSAPTAAGATRSASFQRSASASISAISSPTTESFADSQTGCRASHWPMASRVLSIITASTWAAMFDDPMTPIPQTDPRAGYLAQQDEIDAAIRHVLEGGQYILGRDAEAFEAAFAAMIGVGFGVGTGTGTDAIELAVRACGIGAGDLVFTVSHTAVATVAAIERAGAVPVLVDVEPGGFTMDPAALEAALQKLPPGRPAAVIPVHLYGEPADLASILDLARKYGLRV